MGRWKEVRFWYRCDAKGCSAAGLQADSSKSANKEMLDLGWQRQGKDEYGDAMWFCPDHRRNE